MSANENNSLLQNRYVSLMQELDRQKGTEKLLTRVLTRLTISASGLNPNLDTHLTQLLGLLRQGVGMAAIQTEIEQISEALFRGAMAELEKRKSAAAEQAQEHKQLRRARAAKTDSLDDRFALLFSFIKSRLETDEEIAALNALQARLRQEPPTLESKLFTELEQCLESLLDARRDTANQESTAKTGVLTRLFGNGRKNGASAIDLGSIQKNLLALLDAMDVPITLQAKANRLNEKLMRDLDLDGLLNVFQETVEFLVSTKQDAQREEKFLEEFLSELTGKLAELERQTVGVQALTQASEAGAAEVRATFQDHVENLKLSTRGATDLDSLKALLNQRLESISTYLNAEREEELERHRQTEQQVAQLTQRLQEMEEETAQLRVNLRVQHNLALRDPLSGLPNRMAYDERIHQEITRHKRFGTPFSLVVWDIDHFKNINDRFGHKAGDKALTTIAEILSSEIRETDFVGRFGGEEFVMILTGTGCEDAFEVADGIRLKIETCGFNSHGKPVPITISCGIAQPREEDNQDQVFERADQALYRAKHDGRNRCVIAE